MSEIEKKKTLDVIYGIEFWMNEHGTLQCQQTWNNPARLEKEHMNMCLFGIKVAQKRGLTKRQKGMLAVFCDFFLSTYNGSQKEKL